MCIAYILKHAARARKKSFQIPAQLKNEMQVQSCSRNMIGSSSLIVCLSMACSFTAFSCQQTYDNMQTHNIGIIMQMGFWIPSNSPSMPQWTPKKLLSHSDQKIQKSRFLQFQNAFTNWQWIYDGTFQVHVSFNKSDPDKKAGKKLGGPPLSLRSRWSRTFFWSHNMLQFICNCPCSCPSPCAFY